MLKEALKVFDEKDEIRNFNEINSVVPGEERLSVYSPITDEEEMDICEDRKFSEKSSTCGSFEGHIYTKGNFQGRIAKGMQEADQYING
ncbi:hypothetical protein NPIL_448281 [Nephila pilipes]|uniref:Uncharacterized protein n=1 Tax=Nephila pilipes TaxID=299642 RepID=A0A8X6MGM4_NEPPI|nr:hypothetical protein NPIL_448281 [Nephila pilipes]